MRKIDNFLWSHFAKRFVVYALAVWLIVIIGGARIAKPFVTSPLLQYSKLLLDLGTLEY